MERYKSVLIHQLTSYYFMPDFLENRADAFFFLLNCFFLSYYLCQRWVRFGKDLEMLDSPGIIPMRISDQSAAIKLAICDDIGERSYDAADVAAILVQMLSRRPTVGLCTSSIN